MRCTLLAQVCRNPLDEKQFGKNIRLDADLADEKHIR
jgi:hypothetical protein